MSIRKTIDGKEHILSGTGDLNKYRASTVQDVIDATKVNIGNIANAKLWSGTKEEFDAIPLKEEGTLYNVIDDETEVQGAMTYKGSCLSSELPTSGQHNADYWILTDTSGERVGQAAIWSSDASAWQYSGVSVTVDSSLSTTSVNPVQNKVITVALNNNQLPVGAIFESEGSTPPAYGTWTALADRIEDKWKEHTFSCVNNAGAITYPKFIAKVSEDKQYIDIQLRFTMQVNNVTATTAEIEVANNLKLDGIVWGNIFDEMAICNFADGNNATQAGIVYLSNGSNKIWFGPIKTGGYYGTCTLRKLIPYNSVFTPDKVIKRWKRTA